METEQQQQTVQITGCITYFTLKGKLDFSIVKFKKDDDDGQIIAVGCLSSYAEKEPLVLHGVWDEYTDRKGKKINQFKVLAAFRKRPTDLASLELFLANAVSGCGPVRARQMVRKHGEALFEILQNGRVEKLLEVKGIGQQLAETINNGFQSKSLGYYVAEFLCSIGVNPNWTEAVQRTLGPDAIRIIQKNPYRMTKVAGIGYKKADGIALKLGWRWDSKERAEATLFYALEESGNEGHSFLSRAELIARAAKLMVETQVPVSAAGDSNAPTPAAVPQTVQTEAGLKTILSEALDELYEKKGLIKEVANTIPSPTELTYTPRLYNAELRLASKVRVLLNTPPVCRYNEQQLAWIVQESEKAVDIELTDEQRAAVVQAFTKPISILTGGPGTGKTQTVRILVDVARRVGYSLSQCAPTGRAAKHLSNVTGEPAYTIHRLLKYNADDDRWAVNANDQLDTGMVISDEFSMVDIDLAYRVADAIKPGTPWLIIGDKDQLPAVSPGKVLDDLVISGKIPVTRLTKIFRQAERSLIVQNAHRILRGEELQFPNKSGLDVQMADSYLIEPPEITALDEKGKPKKTTGNKIQKIEDYEWIKSVVLRMCQERIPARLNLDPVRDVQVLTPMKAKGLSVGLLNETLQDALNPLREDVFEVIIGAKRFRTGDRVQQYRNNYRLGKDYEGVSNGDIGFIRSIDEDEKFLHIDFGGENLIPYPFDDAKHDLHLGYAMSIHKSQGGEFPVVIVVLTRANWFMLQRNLLYTAVTRAKQLLVFISGRRLIQQAVKNSVIHKRNSFLATRLRRELEAKPQAAA